jgi:hypothetical protein
VLDAANRELDEREYQTLLEILSVRLARDFVREFLSERSEAA